MSFGDYGKVSVIIPTRNRPEFLRQSVASVLAQSVPAFETIVVNDASDSRFTREMEQIADFSSHIRLYHLPSHMGRSYSRNFGLDRATGDFVLFLDDDDLLDPEMLSTSLHFFQDPAIDVVTCFCKVSYLPRSGRKKLPRVSYLFDCTEKEVSLSEQNFLEEAPFSCIWRSCPPIHSSLIRKSSLDGMQFPEDLNTGEDWYLWLSLAFAKRRFRCNPRAYATVRRHHSNTVAYPSWFSGERTRFLERISLSGMIQSPEDVAILNLRFFLSRIPTNLSAALQSGLAMMRSPAPSVNVARYYFFKGIESKRTNREAEKDGCYPAITADA